MHTLYYCVEVCNTMELEGMHFRRSLFLLHAFESRYLAFSSVGPFYSSSPHEHPAHVLCCSRVSTRILTSESAATQLPATGDPRAETGKNKKPVDFFLSLYMSNIQNRRNCFREAFFLPAPAAACGVDGGGRDEMGRCVF